MPSPFTKVFWWAISSLVSVQAHAQLTDCKSFAIKAYQQVQAKYAMPAKSKHDLTSFAMRIDTYYRLPGQKQVNKSTQQVETVMQGQRLFYTDGATDVYQSPGELVAISKAQHLVYVSNATYSKQQQIIPNIELLRDGIIRESTSSSCSSVTQKGKVYRLVHLVPKQAFREQFDAQYLELLIDERATEVAQYRIVYGPKSRVASVQYTVVASTMLKKARMRAVGTPFSYVLDAHNTLLPQFAGYQLVDQRKH